MQITFDTANLSTQDIKVLQAITAVLLPAPTQTKEAERLPVAAHDFEPVTAVAELPDSPPSTDDGASVDNTGLPWDERIHSSSKKLTAQGRWARRKNLTDAFVMHVEQELRGMLTDPMPVAPPAPAPAPVAPPAPAAPAPVAPPAPAPVAPPAPAPVAPPAPAGDYVPTLQEILKKCTELQTSHRINGVDTLKDAGITMPLIAADKDGVHRRNAWTILTSLEQ